MTADQQNALARVRRAAGNKRQAEERLHALAAEVVTTVPAVHVAQAAGMSRATLYRVLEQHRQKGPEL